MPFDNPREAFGRLHLGGDWTGIRFWLERTLPGTLAAFLDTTTTAHTTTPGQHRQVQTNKSTWLILDRHPCSFDPIQPVHITQGDALGSSWVPLS